MRKFRLPLSVIAFSAFFYLMCLPGCKLGSATLPPRVGGQEVPSDPYQIDFSLRYNLVLGAKEQEQRIDNIKILGYLGKKPEEGGASRSSAYDFFQNWLAIELPDGRRSYLPAIGIWRIEESAVPGKQN